MTPRLQTILDPYVQTGNRLETLQSLFVALGSAMLGAAAIAFSLIMFAMQVNVDRMPYGLFRRFATDMRLLGAFAGTFVLAISIACASLISDTSWISIAIVGVLWAIILILTLFLYAYCRALSLINPYEQLKFIIKDSDHKMQAIVRRAKRAAALLADTNDTQNVSNGSSAITHDMSRLTYFQTNPHWTNGAYQAVKYANSFAKWYAEKGDHEVSRKAMSAIIHINHSYVIAKGRTFFAPNLLFENPLATDGFINETLEHLRQNIRAGISHGDEQQIEQTLGTMADLVQVYLQIEYSSPHASKFHASLAAGYLSEAVKSIAAHDMTDVFMEGVRLMGNSAIAVLAHGTPQEIVTLTDNIGMLGCTGALNKKHHPVTKIAVEQLAKLTNFLIQTNAPDIRFAAEHLNQNVAMIGKIFLNLPDTALMNNCSTQLGPYYSVTDAQSLLSKLANLVNALAKAQPDDKNVIMIIRNIEVWAEKLYETQKELLLLAIEKRSHFTFNMIHWIAEVTKLLLAVSNISGSDRIKNELRRHASWLICTLDWVPDDKDAASIVENSGMTETLFDVAIDAYRRDCVELSETVRKLLLDWAFKGGKHRTGWSILKQSLYGTATLVLIAEDDQAIAELKREVTDKLSKYSLEQQTRERTAQDIRDQATSLHDLRNSYSQIENEMAQLNNNKLSNLLMDLADILSL